MLGFLRFCGPLRLRVMISRLDFVLFLLEFLALGFDSTEVESDEAEVDEETDIGESIRGYGADSNPSNKSPENPKLSKSSLISQFALFQILHR